MMAIPKRRNFFAGPRLEYARFPTFAAVYVYPLGETGCCKTNEVQTKELVGRAFEEKHQLSVNISPRK